MRNQSIVILIGAAVAAYLLFFKKATSYGGASGSWGPPPEPQTVKLPALAASPVPCPGTDAYLTRTTNIATYTADPRRYER